MLDIFDQIHQLERYQQVHQCNPTFCMLLQIKHLNSTLRIHYTILFDYIHSWSICKIIDTCIGKRLYLIYNNVIYWFMCSSQNSSVLPSCSCSLLLFPHSRLAVPGSWRRPKPPHSSSEVSSPNWWGIIVPWYVSVCLCVHMCVRVCMFARVALCVMAYIQVIADETIIILFERV